MSFLKKLYILILCQLISFAGFGQFDENPWQKVSEKSNTTNRKISGKKYIMKYIPQGSHFYHTDWLHGTLFLEDGEIIDSVAIRYNSYLDELVYFNKSLNSMLEIDKYLIDEFTVQSPVFGIQKFRKIDSENSSNDAKYFHVIYEGEITLLAHYITVEIKTSLFKDKNGYLRDTQLVLTETLYTYTPETGFKKFPPFWSSLLKIYSENKKQVKKILRKNRLGKYNTNNLKQALLLIENEGISQSY
jgi:hypothetical protein